jgi:hypothetical protein
MHALRALTAGERPSHRRAGPTTTGVTGHTHARYHYGAATEESQRAVTSACPRRPVRARPRRLKRRARSAELWPRLWALKGPVPYQVRTTLERPEHEARKTPTLERCDYRPVASKPAQCERAPQVPSIYKTY